MKTLSYVRGTQEEIRKGETYYFGQLWDGNGDGQELLGSGCIAIWDPEEQEEEVIDFEIIEENNDILQAKVLVK